MTGTASQTPASGLARARAVQTDAARVGFDWDEAAPVFDKVREELAELAEHGGPGGDARCREDELGDLLFVCVSLARHLDVDPDAALARATRKFERRFARVAELAQASGEPMEALPLAQLDRFWDQAKAEGIE